MSFKGEEKTTSLCSGVPTLPPPPPLCDSPTEPFLWSSTRGASACALAAAKEDPVVHSSEAGVTWSSIDGDDASATCATPPTSAGASTSSALWDGPAAGNRPYQLLWGRVSSPVSCPVRRSTSSGLRYGGAGPAVIAARWRPSSWNHFSGLGGIQEEEGEAAGCGAGSCCEGSGEGGGHY